MAKTLIERPACRKVYVNGARPGVRVPMREVLLAPPNPPVRLYDTSGPYTDPEYQVDLQRGLPPLRRDWIAARGDVEELPQPTSTYRQQREADPTLASLRFVASRKPLRAKAGQNVSQMHYAKRGLITHEMEYIALREGFDQDGALR